MILKAAEQENKQVEEPQYNTEKSMSEPRGNKGKILLVEDNLVNCEVAADMLNAIGQQHDIANNGLQALDMMEQNRYKLILMDCEMPVMDGFATTRELRNRERVRRQPAIPIIALTAHAISGSKEKCIDSGMNDFLSKPFSMADLTLILNKWTNTENTGLLAEEQEKNGSISAEPAKIVGDWRILDRQVITRLYRRQASRGTDLVNNIINIYLDQSAKLLADITAAKMQNDVDRIRKNVHTLKSSSENVGAKTITELCRDIKCMCEQNKIDEALINRLYLYHADVTRALGEILEHQSHLYRAGPA